MAKIVDNPKRFKVIELSRNELAKIGGIGICDRCNGTSNTGYYVAVLNCWFCPKCYNEWYVCATHYPEDIKIENKNFEFYKNLFDLCAKKNCKQNWRKPTQRTKVWWFTLNTSRRKRSVCAPTS